MVPLLSFLGAMLGAALPAFVALRGQRQAARTEWRQRLDKAIDLLASEASLPQRVADELLSDLVRSDLGSGTDQALAERVARVRLMAVDTPPCGTDNGHEDQEVGI